MALSFRDRAAARRAESTAPTEEATKETSAKEVFDNTPVELDESAGVDAAQEEHETDKAAEAEQKAAREEAVAPKTRKQRVQNVGHIVPAGGLAASMSELVSALGANEAEHADILARMRAALGAS